MKIGYYPKYSRNQYIDNTTRLLKKIKNSQVCFVGSAKSLINNFALLKSFRYYDVFIVNWLEDVMCKKNGNVSYVGVVKYFVCIFMLLFQSKKVVYVRHNIYPHRANSSSSNKIAKLTDFGSALCNLRVSHSGHMSNDGYTYLPHPLYRFKNKYNTVCEDYYVMFGRIERYKNIENIIGHWDSRYKLIVFGASDDDQYLRKILFLSQGKNIDIRPGYISDNKAAEIVASSRGLIISHSNADVIVSGSFFFAISLGVPVFALSTPFFDWLKNNYSLISLNVFDSCSEIVNSLAENNSFSKSQRESILNESRAYFGDEQFMSAMKLIIS